MVFRRKVREVDADRPEDWADEVGCVDGSEHDYEIAGDCGPFKVYECRFCDAEIWKNRNA